MIRPLIAGLAANALLLVGSVTVIAWTTADRPADAMTASAPSSAEAGLLRQPPLDEPARPAVRAPEPAAAQAAPVERPSPFRQPLRLRVQRPVPPPAGALPDAGSR